MIRPLARNSKSAARTVIVLERYLAGTIWQAMKYWHISVYSRFASRSISGNCSAERLTSVGRIASWASWAPALER